MPQTAKLAADDRLARAQRLVQNNGACALDFAKEIPRTADNR